MSSTYGVIDNRSYFMWTIQQFELVYNCFHSGGLSVRVLLKLVYISVIA